VRYQFEGGTLDAGRRELRQGDRLVEVEPQVFDLLAFLLKNRERVVSRDDLIEGVWGGRIVSESALATRINAVRRAIGDDGTAQRLVKTIVRKGFRFVGDVREEGDDATQPPARAGALSQRITFCRTNDGVNIAMATVGQGPVLVKTANWLNHLEHDWESPLWSPFLQRLAGRFKLVRYDGRGNGLSDRDVADISQGGFERDLEAVVESAGVERFALLALSQGVAAAVAFAARHPERVSRLVLYGAYAQGRNRRGSPEDAATAQTVMAMMREGWGRADSAFMRAFSSLYVSDASRTHIQWFADMQRLSTSAEVAARLRVACDDIDVVDILPQIKVPTLVIHARQDHVAPYEQGRLLASRIPGARLITLESENHVPVPDDPVWPKLMDEIEAFAAGG
jgi:DNA-binding winged helix-turn-helix (wHTH) protein/pimeloyl-ACP methyl ester carboxylesterase